MHPFSDHFSSIASSYAAFRPHYPDALFAALADLAPARDLVWDCGAGSGQATVGLLPHFARIIATDASAGQLAKAPPDPRIEYRVAPAEASGLSDGSVAMVTVAQALHWFDADRFFAEARRVLRPAGVIAVWAYQIAWIDRGPIDQVLHHLAYDTLGAYWPGERGHVEAGYRTLPFPFEELPPPHVRMTAEWTLLDLAGYIHTWSAAQQYKARHSDDPVEAIMPRLAELWGPPESRRTIEWPLVQRVGRV